MVSAEERVSRLEGAYEHLATKADIAAMEARMVKWFAGLLIGTAIGTVTATVALIKLLS